ncbi:MAG: gamma carbonic anhydrase family protein [Desulfobulbus sp.]|nr:gamma carbonic anhydrase family protein [Desulfobulbus sp.]
MILPYRDYQPQVGKGGWVAPNATLIGDTVLGEDVSLWFGVIVRGDVHRIRIGARTNIQDLCLLHITQHVGEERDDADGHPTIIGSECTVGHRVILHGCTVGDLCLIGMGAILLDGAEIGRESIVGAGSVVTPGKKFPPRSLIMGTPAKVVREVSEAQVQEMHASWRRYVALKNEYHQAKLGDCF